MSVEPTDQFVPQNTRQAELLAEVAEATGSGVATAVPATATVSAVPAPAEAIPASIAPVPVVAPPVTSGSGVLTNQPAEPGAEETPAAHKIFLAAEHVDLVAIEQQIHP